MNRSIASLFFLAFVIACTNSPKPQQKETPENLIALLDTVWHTEQEPIRLRDSLMKIYGADSKQFQEQQEIYRNNHIVNEQIVTNILDKYGWPTREMVGEDGNLILCNVIQHSENDIRLKYLPLMRQAVKDNKLEPRLLCRAEDRIATERGDLQIYGTQIKYYPETKTLNVWPLFDPVNVDKRRSEIGLGPIAEFLKNRFEIEWNVSEQIKRTEEFVKTQQQN